MYGKNKPREHYQKELIKVTSRLLHLEIKHIERSICLEEFKKLANFWKANQMWKKTRMNINNGNETAEITTEKIFTSIDQLLYFLLKN